MGTGDSESEELRYKGKYPIRTVKADGTLWFAAPDLVYALGFSGEALRIAAESPAIPDYCRSSAYERPAPDISGPPDDAVVLLSPVGVWYWTVATNAPRGQNLASWTRRETARLVPEASKDDPATFLALGPDGEMPPYPMRYSGRKREWIALKEKHGSLGLYTSSLRTQRRAASSLPPPA